MFDLIKGIIRIFILSLRLPQLFNIAAAVVSTFMVCWLPFIRSKESVLQVLHRVFPLARGLYEVMHREFHKTLEVDIIIWLSVLIFLMLIVIPVWKSLFRECRILDDYFRIKLRMCGAVCQSLSSLNSCLLWISWSSYGKFGEENLVSFQWYQQTKALHDVCDVHTMKNQL